MTTKSTMNVNFSIIQDNKTEAYLGDVIGNNVTEAHTFDKALKDIENLG